MKRFFHITLLLVALFCAKTFAQDPAGDPIGPGNEVHDQRAGSMLIYNYYTSRQWDGVTDTRITLTNTHETQAVQVNLYFVEGGTGQVVPASLSFTPGQTQTFLVSDYDPNITGYIIAIASNGITPIQFDHLLGTAAITLASGHQATLGALAVPTNPNGYYAALPRQLALDQLHSPSDSIKQMLVINRIDGSLVSDMPAIGRLRCDLFNQAGARFSFNSRSLGPQVRTYFYDLVNATSFITYTYLYNYLPAGEYGWLRMHPVDAGAITGAVLYFRDAEGSAIPHYGSYNLRHLTTTQATLEVSNALLQFGY